MSCEAPKLVKELHLCVFRAGEMKSRNFRYTLLAVAIVFLSGFTVFHKFYVSLTEIRVNAGSSRLEVSMRIFPDDLDKVFFELYGLESNLATSLEPPEADTLLGAYLRLHFKVTADGEPVSFTYLGKEPESDAIWCYLESEPIPTPRILKIHNTILMYQFEDQVNIIQVYVGEWNRGLLLTDDEPEGGLHIGE